MHSNSPIFGNDDLSGVYLVSDSVSYEDAMDLDGKHCNEQNVVNYGIYARIRGYVMAYLAIYLTNYVDNDSYHVLKGLEGEVLSSVPSSERMMELIN